MSSLAPLFWTFALRPMQAFIWASPYVLFGACAAGILRASFSPVQLRAAFDADSRASAFRLWLFSILLPWSSFGVLPAARQLKHAGIRPGVILTFLLAAPLVNPLTIAFALSVLPLRAAAMFVAGAVFVPATVAAVCGRFPGKCSGDPEALSKNAPPTGGRRVIFALMTASFELTGPMARDLLVGLLGVGLLAVIVPGDVLEHTLAKPGLIAPPLAALVAAPAYISPDQGMMMAGVAYVEGNSLGAAFALLALGVGVNLAWFWRLGRGYGWRRLVYVAAPMFLVVILYGYLMDLTLPHLRSSLDHHHALTDLGPAEGFDNENVVAQMARRLHRDIGPSQEVSLLLIVAMTVTGLSMRWLDRSGQVTRWLNAPAAAQQNLPAAWWNRAVSTRSVGIACVVFAAAGITTGSYVFFPSPEALVIDLQYTAADASSAALQGDRQQAVERLDRLAGLVGKLTISARLRRGSLTPTCQFEAQSVRNEIAALRAVIFNGTPTEIKAAGLHVQEALTRFHRAYSRGGLKDDPVAKLPSVSFAGNASLQKARAQQEFSWR